jgi:GntR family transcriptional regulator
VDLRVTVRTTVLPARGASDSAAEGGRRKPTDRILSLARVYVPRDLTPSTALGDRSARAWAEASFSVPDPPSAGVHETVSARLPTPDEASTRPFNTTVAVLAITRVAADNAGRVIEAALLVFPGDRVDAVFSTHRVIEEGQAHR